MSQQPIAVGDTVTFKTPLARIQATSKVLDVYVDRRGSAYLVEWGDGPNARTWTSAVRKVA